MAKQMRCRILITHAKNGKTFALGMYDPLNLRHEPLGNTHPIRDIDKIVSGLRHSMERAGHEISFSEVTAPR